LRDHKIKIPDQIGFASFDETVYMLQVPTDTARIVEQGVTVLLHRLGLI